MSRGHPTHNISVNRTLRIKQRKAGYLQRSTTKRKNMTTGQSKEMQSPHLKKIDATEFAGFAANHLELWSIIEHANVYHATYGTGKIIRVEQRSDYIPLIYVQFENGNEERTFNSDSFKSGVIGTIQVSTAQHDALQNWKKKHCTSVRQSKQPSAQIAFADFGVDALWHMSHRDNISNICHSGILSHHEAHKSYSELVDISDPEVQRWREQKPPNSSHRIHEYAPLWRFRTKSATDSDPNRPPIPFEIGHRFRSKSAGHSEANRPPLGGVK